MRIKSNNDLIYKCDWKESMADIFFDLLSLCYDREVFFFYMFNHLPLHSYLPYKQLVWNTPTSSTVLPLPWSKRSFNFSPLFSLWSVIITTVLYLSDALRKNFLNDKFDYKVREKRVACVCLCVWGGAKQSGRVVSVSKRRTSEARQHETNSPQKTHNHYRSVDLFKIKAPTVMSV